MHEQAESVGLTGPEAANLTIFALLTPGLGVKMSLRVEGRDGPANHGRLCVKGRYGFDYVHHQQRLTTVSLLAFGVLLLADAVVELA